MAFDSISHSILIEKQTGMTNWFGLLAICLEDYRLMAIYCGVPQSSILEPLLSIVFQNNFSDHLEYCDVITFADDTVIIISDKNHGNIETKLNIVLEKVSTYFHLNEFAINLKKENQKLLVQVSG